MGIFGKKTTDLSSIRAKQEYQKAYVEEKEKAAREYARFKARQELKSKMRGGGGFSGTTQRFQAAGSASAKMSNFLTGSSMPTRIKKRRTNPKGHQRYVIIKGKAYPVGTKKHRRPVQTMPRRMPRRMPRHDPLAFMR